MLIKKDQSILFILLNYLIIEKIDKISILKFIIKS